MWFASMHGNTDHLTLEEATALEKDLVAKLTEVFGGLVEAGHQGVAGEFQHSHEGAVNLAGEMVSPDPATLPPPPPGEVAVGAAADAVPDQPVDHPMAGG